MEKLITSVKYASMVLLALVSLAALFTPQIHAWLAPPAKRATYIRFEVPLNEGETINDVAKQLYDMYHDSRPYKDFLQQVAKDNKGSLIYTGHMGNDRAIIYVETRRFRQ